MQMKGTSTFPEYGFMMLQLRLIILSLMALFFSTVAMALPGHVQAEYERLNMEMERLSERQAWRGVDRMYVQMIDLGVVPSYSDNLLAAEASRHLGEVAQQYERLKLAASQQNTADLESSIRRIENTHGLVQLSIARPKDAALILTTPGINPDTRRTVEAAERMLQTKGEFVGMLPSGDYNFSGRTVSIQAGITLSVHISRRARTETFADGRKMTPHQLVTPPAARMPEAVTVAPAAVEVRPPNPEPVVIEQFTAGNQIRVRDEDGREPWTVGLTEAAPEPKSSVSSYEETKVLGSSRDAMMVMPSNQARLRARRAGVGASVLTVMGLGTAGYAAYQYTLVSNAHDRYMSTSNDDEALDIWSSEVQPAKQRLFVSGFLGSASLISSGIIWTTVSTNSGLQVGVGPQRVGLSGRF